ncbi:hypothetical protein J25TS5_17050 [Paenibacillus faecis]|nr:hypothetical protein J25TS5_17050 [Paenibacillus faecis]
MLALLGATWSLGRCRRECGRPDHSSEDSNGNYSRYFVQNGGLEILTEAIAAISAKRGHYGGNEAK